MSCLGVGELTLKFSSFMAGLFGDSSLLLGGTKGLEISWVDCVYAVERCFSFIYGVAYLIGMVSFGITRLICASFGITRLVRVWRGADRRGARRMREGHMDASGFLYASANYYVVTSAYSWYQSLSFSFCRLTYDRFRDLIMQMQEQQQPAPPAHAPTSVVPQVLPNQLSAEAKHLRDFRKYNPMTFDGSLEDSTEAQMWLSSLETIFRYI
ncbi:gag protease polyprotein [Cucumis melo var. makuwa]|uniref:Gag protease polyprotein n=1 Tax=Cucumis melo var. makuwa TaxID=1194695 RepID=A0A5A7V2R4_CUCMM|nr:gag protease polyprotein [Cucumis melo var. makuwa]